MERDTYPPYSPYSPEEPNIVFNASMNTLNFYQNHPMIPTNVKNFANKTTKILRKYGINIQFPLALRIADQYQIISSSKTLPLKPPVILAIASTVDGNLEKIITEKICHGETSPRRQSEECKEYMQAKWSIKNTLAMRGKARTNGSRRSDRLKTIGGIIQHIGNSLGLPKKVIDQALDLLNDPIFTAISSGRQAKIVATTALAIVLGNKIMIETLAKKTSIAPATIRTLVNRYREKQRTINKNAQKTQVGGAR